MQRLPQTLLFALLLALALPTTNAVAAIAGYTQNWDNEADGTAGWTGVLAISTTTLGNPGGNPGGYLRDTLAEAGDTDDVGGRALASIPALTGDYSGAGWSMRFDILLEEGQVDATMMRLRGTPPGGGWVIDLAAPGPVGSWSTRDVAFNGDWSEAQARAAGWMPDNEHPLLNPDAADSVSWAATIANVRAFSIRFSGEGTLTAGIDNFSLNNVSFPVPEPSTALMLALGLSVLSARRTSKNALSPRAER